MYVHCWEEYSHSNLVALQAMSARTIGSLYVCIFDFMRPLNIVAMGLGVQYDDLVFNTMKQILSHGTDLDLAI